MSTCIFYYTICLFIHSSLLAISIVANKIDLSDSNRQVTMNRGVTFAHSLGAMFTETSAAQNIGN